jgi:L-serine/L-threonine ammonia-lyase
VPLFRNTPYVRSDVLSNKLRAAAGPYATTSSDVFLKLDALQPTGSFKDRGVSHLCRSLKVNHNARALVTASGGNAGLAVARAGQVLGMAVRVVVPKTAKRLVLDRMRDLYGAEVVVFGENFDAANAHALELVAADSAAHFVPPFDHPLLWEGHASLVDEIAEASNGEAPGAIVVSVGGGGLLCGVCVPWPAACACPQSLAVAVVRPARGRESRVCAPRKRTGIACVFFL